MSADLSSVPHVATPAAREFVALLSSGDPRGALEVLDEHWTEIWFALDPADLKKILLAVPAEEQEGLRIASYVNALVGAPVFAAAAEAPVSDSRQRLEEVGQRVADLRLAGKPEEALALARTVAEDAGKLRGRLVDTSGGRFAVWMVQAGITALLAGDLTRARASLLLATDPHRPDRFPFVAREALAKLALTHAVIGEPAEAKACLTRAEQQPRTTSWVESLVDHSLQLTRYICAIDGLELDDAEAMRLADPSPFSHLEFWGLALQAQVRHLCLTGRHDQARKLCDEVGGAGLPLPGSDGWLSRILTDARLQCGALDTGQSAQQPGTFAEVALARRLRLLTTGRFHELTTRGGGERSQGVHTRSRLALDLIRGQGLLHSGQAGDGRRVLTEALSEAFERGTLEVLRFLTAGTLEALEDTEVGARARRLVDEHGIVLVEVRQLLQSPLTAAEKKVLQMLAEGMSRAQMAKAAYVSVETVKSQLRAAYRKLGVGNRLDAVAAFEQLEG